MPAFIGISFERCGVKQKAVWVQGRIYDNWDWIQMQGIFKTGTKKAGNFRRENLRLKKHRTYYQTILLQTWTRHK